MSRCEISPPSVLSSVLGLNSNDFGIKLCISCEPSLRFELGESWIWKLFNLYMNRVGYHPHPWGLPLTTTYISAIGDIELWGLVILNIPPVLVNLEFNHFPIFINIIHHTWEVCTDGIAKLITKINPPVMKISLIVPLQPPGIFPTTKFRVRWEIQSW